MTEDQQGEVYVPVLPAEYLEGLRGGKVSFEVQEWARWQSWVCERLNSGRVRAPTWVQALANWNEGVDEGLAATLVLSLWNKDAK